MTFRTHFRAMENENASELASSGTGPVDEFRETAGEYVDSIAITIPTVRHHNEMRHLRAGESGRWRPTRVEDETEIRDRDEDLI